MKPKAEMISFDPDARGVSKIPGFAFPDGPYRERETLAWGPYRPLEYWFHHELQSKRDGGRSLIQRFRIGMGVVEARAAICGDAASLNGAETYYAAALAAEAIRQAVLSDRFNC